MAEPYCVELMKPVESEYALGWYIRALRTEMGSDYYLTVGGTVDADMGGHFTQNFYFKTEQDAYAAMKKYFEDWGEPFPYEDESNNSVQMFESETMTFI